MNIVWLIVILVMGAILIKALLNGYKAWRLISLEKQYHIYMERVAANQATPEFLEKTPEIIDLFRKAGQRSTTITRVEPAGLGFARTLQINLFRNITLNDEGVYSVTSAIFKQAIGVYKKNIYDAFNPFYWLEFLIYLPQNIIKYVLGNEAIPNWLIRLANVIYWVIGVVATIIKLLTYFKQ